MQAMNSATAATSSTVWLVDASLAHSCRPRMVKVPEAPNMIAVPTNMPMSPTRTVRNALTAARAFASSSHQCPISRNEHKPMISQPRMSCTMFSASTIVNMPALNSVIEAKKWVYRRSPRTYSSE